MNLNGKEIKKELCKALNLKSNLISVTCKGNLLSSISVKLKSEVISLDEVDKYLSKYEKIRYCDYSGEILQGCNTFVNVSYDWALFQQENIVELSKKLFTEAVERFGREVW